MKKIANILFGLFVAIEAVLMFAMNYLEKLAYKKAGVNHHLYFKKGEYMHKYLTPKNIKMLTIIAAVLIIIYVIVCIKAAMSSRKMTAVAALLAAVWGAILEYSLHSAEIADRLIYPYLILVLIICIALSTISIIINRKFSA